MKKLLLSFCLLAACVTPVKVLQLQQAVVKTADISTVSWLAKKNAECITLASKQAEQKAAYSAVQKITKLELRLPLKK